MAKYFLKNSMPTSLWTLACETSGRLTRLQSRWSPLAALRAIITGYHFCTRPCACWDVA
uniref:Uncharacterized protein n=1 Tax=Anguilla anguilla TaxID=7936 RepID=A0A0E9TDB0_ANGAN